MKKAFGLSLMICIMLLVNVSLTFAAGRISVDPTSHDYGEVELNDSVDQTFTITNEGFLELEVTSITLTGANPSEFSIDDDSGFTLPRRESKDIGVTFTPTSAGNKSATLRITNNSFNDRQLDVPLTGIGVDTTNPEVVYMPLDGDWVDPYVSEAIPTIVLSFTKPMDTDSVELATGFTRYSVYLDEYEDLNTGVEEPFDIVNFTNLSTYAQWYPGQFLLDWDVDDTTLQISFKGTLQSPITGRLLRPDGLYRLVVTSNATDKSGNPLIMPDGKTDYYFNVPGYGNVDLSPQFDTQTMEFPIYITPSDSYQLLMHITQQPGWDLVDYFAGFGLSEELFNEIADVDDSGDLTGMDPQYILCHIADPNFYPFPNFEPMPAPNLQEPAAGDTVVMSIGWLTDPNDCYSIVEPAVIAI
jgi:hypothetical protein